MITINWKLGEEQGIVSCSSDREAEKFSEKLLAKKLEIVGLKPTTVTSFQNKVYSLRQKIKKASLRRKRTLEREFAPYAEKLELLKSVPLSIQIERA